MGDLLRHPGSRLLAPLCTTLVLASCGGGGGNDTVHTIVFKTAALNGAQVSPAVTTAANGNGSLRVDMDSGSVTGTITTVAMTGTSAHVHDGAVGTNGGVVLDLTQSSPGSWTVPAAATLTAAQRDSLRNGTLYVDVHTAANPNGEIRGQVGRQVYFASLTPAQEVPATTSSATGTGVYILDPETNTMSGTTTQTGVVATVAHIHIGPVGTAASVVFPFTGGPATWTMPPAVLTADQLASLNAGNFYANVHSATFPGGEIRGQLYQPVRSAALSGAQEAPPNSSTATGTGWFMVNPFTRAIAGRMAWSGVAATDAHIHNAAPGVAGGIVIRGTVTTGNPGSLVIDSSTPLADNLFAAFMTGNLYYNVHSAAFPSGEIRGQLTGAQ